jgi:uncharacterized repeat protein (TIGR01451 family)
VLVDIPADPLVAVAGPVALNVTVSSQGGGAGIAATLSGAVTVDAVSAFTASFQQTGPLAAIEDEVDRVDRDQRDYLIYIRNLGNRAESLTLSRAQISGWSIILLVNGQPGSALTVPAGGNASAVVRIASFPQNDPGQTVSVSVRTADNLAPPVSLSIRVSFLEPDVDFTSAPVEIDNAEPTSGSTIGVTVSVRNSGAGTATGVVVRLIVDGQAAVDSKTLTLAPNRTQQVTLSWTVGDEHSGKSHTVAVEIQGGSQVNSDTSVVVPAVQKGLVAKLTTDRDVQMLVGGIGLLLFIVGFAVRGRGRSRAAPAPAPAAGPAPAAASPESALEGLAALEAEGAGGAPAPEAAPAGPAPVEHKIVCPNCNTEQWIKGAEGECTSCGVIIEVSVEEDEAAPGGA